MISKRLFDELNKQVTYEYFSSHFYLAMEAYCASQNLDGFANFFKVQVEEERAHGKLFFDYINRMNGTVTIEGLDKPEGDFENLLDVFKKAYKHEQFVTSRIYHLMDIALEEKEHATASFLKWFIDEQIEEEETFSNLIKKLEMIGDNVSALYALDQELAQRTFVPPAPAQA